MRQSFTTQPALFVSAEALDHPALHALDEIEKLIDWDRIDALLPQGEGSTGRPGYPALTLFRALLLGLWHNLSDGKLEAQLARDLLFRRFCRLEFDCSVPDATVLCRYRGELREGDLLERLLEEINGQLTRAGVMLEQGRIAIVDATVIEASQSGAVHGDEEAGFAHKPNPRGTMAKTRGWKAFVNCDKEGFIHATALRPGHVHEGHVLSDLLSGPFGVDSLRYAILIATAAYLWAGAHFLLAGKTIRQDLEAAENASAT